MFRKGQFTINAELFNVCFSVPVHLKYSVLSTQTNAICTCFKLVIGIQYVQVSLRLTWAKPNLLISA